MPEDLGVVHKLHVKYHPGNVVTAALRYQIEGNVGPEYLKLLADYRDEVFDPYPDESFYAWTEYLIASEFAARFFDR